MRKIMIVFLLASLPVLYGFATITSGTSQNLTINSDPSGALVSSGGIMLGTTPLVANIKREQNKSLVVKKEGYEDQVIYLATTFNNAFWGNFLIGGTFGSTTDAASGATIEYSPSSYYITLKPEKASKMQENLLEKKMMTRNFILSNYHNLTSDIARGDGEHLSTLYAVFDVGKENRSITLNYLRDMLSRHQNIPSFAEAVVDRFTLDVHS